MAWYDIITKPIRGIGRILRGKFQEGLHDIGSAASSAAPFLAFIPGVGTITAPIVGAAGSFLEEVTDEDPGLNPMNVVGGAAGGMMGNVVSGAVGGGKGVYDFAKGGLKGVGNVLGLGGGGAGGAAGAAAAPAAAGGGFVPSPVGMMPMMAGGGGAGAGTAGAGAKAASLMKPLKAGATVPGAASTTPAGPGGLRGMWEGLGPIGQAAVIGQGAGAAANMYGAYQMGRAEDREWRRRREMSRRLSPMVTRLISNLTQY